MTTRVILWDADGKAVASEVQPEPQRLCHVTRSFSYKCNAGNYESRDWFMSQGVECYENEAESASERVYNFVRSQVMKSVREYENDPASLRRDVEAATRRNSTYAR